MIYMWLALGALAMNAVSSAKRTTKARVQRSFVTTTGVEVSPGCDVYDVVDHDTARLTFQRTYADERLGGETDPGRIAKAVMRRIDPKCVRGVFPRNRGQLGFYAQMHGQVVVAMLEDGVLGQDQAAAEYQHFGEWHDYFAQRLT